MNILFVVENRSTPNYLCVQKVAEACLERGHNVYILSQGYEKNEHYGFNTKIKEYSIKPDFATNLVYKCSKTKLKGFSKFIYRLFILLFTPMWPIRAPFYINRLRKNVNSVIKREKIDLAVLTHVSIENLLVARKRMDQVIYVGYFLDLLVGGMKLSYMSEKTWKKKSLSAENKVMKFLDYGIMMDSYRRIYAENGRREYAEKIRFLDLPMLSKTTSGVDDNQRKIFSEDEIILLFVGSMANNVRDPRYILELISRVKIFNVRFVIVGNSDYSDVINEYAMNDNRIEYLGRKTHEESIRMMKEADYLINIGNNLDNMVPSKIFEYMSYRKPIISTYKVDNDPCMKPLQKYGLYLSLDERISEAENAIRLQQFIESNKKIEIDDIRYRELTNRDGELYCNTPEAFVDMIESLV